MGSVSFTSNDFADCFNGGRGDGALGGLAQTTAPVDGSVEIGQYYYNYFGPQSACVSDSLTAEQQSDTATLKNDLKTLQAN